MTSMWTMSIIALLVMDLRTGAIQQERQPLRCHQCSPTNVTSCEEQTGWLTATCPGARPYCSTVVTGPDFSSWLGCAAATDSPCSLTNSPTQTLELTCVCTSHLCNAPFNNKLRSELFNFSSNTNESALTEAFFKLSKFANVSQSSLYKAITVEVPSRNINTRNITEVTTGTVKSVTLVSEMLPRAEALKQATVPSEDDEDEGEGSGSLDEARVQGHAAAPAPPSSYLPANENNAQRIIPHLLFTPLFLTYILI